MLAILHEATINNMGISNIFAVVAWLPHKTTLASIVAVIGNYSRGQSDADSDAAASF